MNLRFEFSDRLRSVRYAVHGLGIMLASQHNARIHAACTVVVLVAGLAWRLSALEWCAVVVAIVVVWVAEGLNTALELLADAASPAFHPLIGQAKDVAAGAVLLAALGAVVMGGLIFGPYAIKTLTSDAEGNGGHQRQNSNHNLWKTAIPSAAPVILRAERVTPTRLVP